MPNHSLVNDSAWSARTQLSNPKEYPMDIQTTTTPLVTSKQDRKALHQQALAESQQEIDQARASLLEKITDHVAIGGVDKYDGAILHVISRAGTNGVTAAELHAVCADSEELTASRRRLVSENKISEEKSGMTWRLKLVTPTPAATPQTAAA